MLDALLCALDLHRAHPRAPKTAGSSAAATTACPDDVQSGRLPAVVKLKVAAGTFALCLKGFVTLFSGVTRTPVYSAEHLTTTRVDAARGMVKINSFYPELRLPVEISSDLGDFRGSGYDLDHTAPNGDMCDKMSQRDSFGLANMVPQNHDNIESLWSAIEEAIRGCSGHRTTTTIGTPAAFSPRGRMGSASRRVSHSTNITAAYGTRPL